MKSISVNTFLSCSRSPDDAEVVALVRALCEGLAMDCYTVDGAADTPIEAAKEEIRSRPAFVAVATRRKPLKGGKHQMSDAVSQEINIATALGKQIALLVENGVDDQAMGRTADLRFTRAKICDPNFLRKLVGLLHEVKLRCIQRHQLMEAQAPLDYHAEEAMTLRKLVETDSGFVWNFSLSRHLVFDQELAKPIDVAIWPAVPVEVAPGARDLIFNVGVDSGSRTFHSKFRKILHKADSITGALNISPTPKKGDHLKYHFEASSRYFAPIYKFTGAKSQLEIAGKKFHAFSGNVPTRRFKKLKMKFVFPRSYKLSPDEINAFAGVYSNHVTDVVSSEMGRIQSKVEDFGGEVHASLEVDEPLIGYAYGFAWNPVCKGKDAHHP